jgi:hypothetical protein
MCAQVPDTLEDLRFRGNPLVSRARDGTRCTHSRGACVRAQVTGAPNIRFYAGAQLRAANGAPLGTVCVRQCSCCVVCVAPRCACACESVDVLTHALGVSSIASRAR